MAENSYARLPELMAEAVRRHAAVIVAAGGSPAALAAKAATSTVPIIMLAGDDPVRLGLVASISRPGGNVTGVAQLVIASENKRLELMRELLPGARTFALLSNPARPDSKMKAAELGRAAESLGVALLVVEATADDDLPGVSRAARSTVAFRRIRRSGLERRRPGGYLRKHLGAARSLCARWHSDRHRSGWL
jgi:putative ABC transport system substrate-binding protein